jgi:hypothetical protein
MGDPLSERAHYLAVRGGTGDLFLIQAGRVEHLGLFRTVHWRATRAARADQAIPRPAPSSALGRAIAGVLALVAT